MLCISGLYKHSQLIPKLLICTQPFGDKSSYTNSTTASSSYNSIVVRTYAQDHTLNISTDNSETHSQKSKSNREEWPSPEMKLHLTNLVSTMFNSQHEYSLMRKDIVLENNLFGEEKTSSGVFAYAIELLRIRLKFHSHHTKITIEVKDSEVSESDKNVFLVYWKMMGVPQNSVFKFWQNFNFQASKKDFTELLHGVSYFHIGDDGFISKHRLDKAAPHKKIDSQDKTISQINLGLKE
ncbi:uncharacterized protein LOC131934052 isoform X2 [Physella acuta]|nr:uncharacterized protein LOC131934052 isoform X2 [Physella acuta]